MEKLITSDFKLGIISGGQLGKMLVLAASNWDIKTYILDKDVECPASGCCTKIIAGDPRSYEDVYRFGKTVDMLTFEVENVNIEALRQLKKEGKKINPSPEVIEMIQDKGLQKQFYADNNIPTAPFVLYGSRKEIIEAVKDHRLQIPFVQKLRKGGYDGRGVAIIKSENDLNNLLDGASVAEQLVEVEKEISVIAARNANAEIKCFPVVEMLVNEKANLVEMLICPAGIKSSIESKASQLAEKIIASLNLSGLLAVEMFVDKNENVLVNEIAPRPHNSGHHTIESAITSQFEQMLRAIFNFPLGSTQLNSASVMINLLGEPDADGLVKYEGMTECLNIDGVKIHLYGKKLTKPFRKMGHVTVLGNTLEEAKEKAIIVKQKLKIKSW